MTISKWTISIIFFCTILFAQNLHIPPCRGSNHSTSICRGYAVARAFGKHWNSSICPASTLHFDSIPTGYFDIITFPNSQSSVQSILNNIKNGDIILWNGGAAHAAYVTHVPQNGSISTDDVIVSQVQQENGSEQTGLQLSTVISQFSGSGPPDGYARKIKAWSLKVENNFSGGTYGFNNDILQHQEVQDNLNWGSTYSLKATMDSNVFQGYKRLFDHWEKANSSPLETSNQNSYSITIKDYSTVNPIVYNAIYKKEFNITVESSFAGIGNFGMMTINGVSTTLPTTILKVKEGETFVLEAPITQTFNHIQYSFSSWSNGNTNNTITVTPSDHDILIAAYTGKPIPLTQYGLSSNITAGEYVTLNWSEHPNTQVTRYDIWREVKPKFGPRQYPPVYIASVNRGVTTWTDFDYKLTTSYTDNLLMYDARAYYSTEGTNASEDYIVCFGEEDDIGLPKIANHGNLAIPNQYSIHQNHPNPFNPTTTIKYEIPVASSVSISIYDIRGNEVKTWESGNESPGYKQITWQATDTNGNKVPAGIYIFKLTATSHETDKVFSKSIKMVLLK